MCLGYNGYPRVEVSGGLQQMSLLDHTQKCFFFTLKKIGNTLVQGPNL
jgi:hypothetical protein